MCKSASRSPTMPTCCPLAARSSRTARLTICATPTIPRCASSSAASPTARCAFTIRRGRWPTTSAYPHERAAAPEGCTHVWRDGRSHHGARMTALLQALGARTLKWLLSLGHSAYFFADLLRFSPLALRRFGLVVAQVHAIGNRSL